MGSFGAIALTLAMTLALTTPASALGPPHDESNGIECLDCHSLHGGAMGVVKPVGEAQELVCLSCHNPTGQAASMWEVGMHTVEGGAVVIDCGSCHDVHMAQVSVDPHPGGVAATNLKLIRPDTATYVPGALEPAVFQQAPGHYAFGDDDPPWSGVCQTCHTKTAHHTQDGSSDHHHQMGLACTLCHPHGEGFQPVGGCTECHAVPQGPRRQIVGPGGDFDKTSHHVQSEIAAGDCTACHYVGDHESGTVRLRDPDFGLDAIHDWDPAVPATVEDFCLGCHDADGATALEAPKQPFSDGVTPPDVAMNGAMNQALSGGWGASAHASIGFEANDGFAVSCLGDGSSSGCHANAHGSDTERLLAGGAGTAVSDTCLGCHTEGGVTNLDLGGAADDIAEAFGMAEHHDMGAAFEANGETYELACSTCHNPHLVTGRHEDALVGASPVTRPALDADPVTNPRAMGSSVFGVAADEKIDAYAAAGTYRAPKGDVLTGAELPDYATFCLDCHAQPGPAPFGKNWAADPHGLQSANAPNTTCPNWYGCGKGEGWDGDDCIADEATCWPVVARGAGYQIWTRKNYHQVERIAGANFVLACTDCHEAHGSPVSSMLRATVNGGEGTWIWNTMCNNCHYYYSDFHAGMSCGTASCHAQNSIHGMGASVGTGHTKIFDQDLVADLQFNGNLNDSGTWNLHSRWFDTVGSYVSGVSGSAVSLDGDQVIELGTTNDKWSTDEGYHGTWKYSEMKYHTTLEAWVRPTSWPTSSDGIAVIMSKYQDGGYELHLTDIDGALRLAFQVNVNGGGEAEVWDADCNGWRGAFSDVPIELDRWTHVAATYDWTLPDSDPGDLAVGRARVYLDGEDVTTSRVFAEGECYAQPGAGEDTIFPYSAHSQLDPARCYEGHWCAWPLSFGGRMWGTGQRRGLTGHLDQARVWNVTHDAASFDARFGPSVASVTGSTGEDLLVVRFSEGLWADEGSSLPLSPGDLTLGDAGGDNPRSIVAVTHVAGASDALVTMSAPLIAADLGADTLALVAGAAWDEHGNASGAGGVAIAKVGCPVGPGGGEGEALFELDEAAGATTAADAQEVIVGAVSGGDAFVGDGAFHGDGVDNVIDFGDNPTCLVATDSLVLEARFRPDVVDDGEISTIQRVFLKNGSNYQMSVWRNLGDPWTATFAPPDGVASLAFWLEPLDAHGGANWKPALTDYDACPIVAGHWYQVRLLWDSSTVGAIPATFWIDDQGTDGLGAGELWAGEANCTDADQSQLPADRWLEPGDVIESASGTMHIGGTANHTLLFQGLIDWVRVSLTLP